MIQEAICGIYKITSPTNRIYIGQSIDIERRFIQYKRYKIRTQRKLSNSLKKYGPELHKFEVIHRCNENELNQWETYYIGQYNCFNTENGLNLRIGGEGIGRMSDETKRLIGASKQGKKRKPFTDEAKEKMRQSQYGRKHSDATKGKMSVWQKGVKKDTPSQETRDKIRIANTGKKRTEEFKLNNKHNLGKKMSDEVKNKISNANRGNKWTDEQKSNLSKIRRNENRIVSLETRIKISNNNRNRVYQKATEESRQNMRIGNFKSPPRNGKKYKGVRGANYTSEIINGVKIYYKWYAAIKINGKTIYLGQYDTQIEAAKIYNEAVIKYFGGHAYLNEITE